MGLPRHPWEYFLSGFNDVQAKKSGAEKWMLGNLQGCLLQQRVENHVHPDFDGVVVHVADAGHRSLPLQRKRTALLWIISYRRFKSLAADGFESKAY